jgi:MinD-like ATPase involved in chromosome partitioning or flagellar assembly
MAEMTMEAYGVLLAFLGRYYDAILLDCGTGITDPVARFAVRRADQVLVVSTPEFVTAQTVLASLELLQHDRSLVVLNQAELGAGERSAIERRFGRERTGPRIAIPYDDQLRSMLDSATYSLEGLERRVRLPIKRLALAVAERLV